MTQPITLTLPVDVKQALDKLAQEEGISPDEAVGQAVRQLVFLRQYRSLPARLLAKAKNQGVLTDQDVFDRVS